MKTIPYIMIIVLIGLLMYSHYTKPETLPPDETKIKQLEQEIADRDIRINSLKEEVNQLLEENKKIEYIIVQETASIDSAIEKDSTQAIPEYRKAILLFDWLPDGTPELTFREIGIGTKIITKAHGMQLQIKNYQDALELVEETNKEYEGKISGLEDLIKLKDISSEYWHNEFKKTQGFWYDRFVVTVGPGIGYGDNKFSPFIGVIAGVKIWGSE